MTEVGKKESPQSPERLSKFEKVALASSVDYPGWISGEKLNESVVRGILSMETVRAYLETGSKVVICYSDRTSESYLDSLQNYSYGTLPRALKEKDPEKGGLFLVRQQSGGLSESRSIAIKKARELAGVEVIITTEPEKVSLSEKRNIEKLINPILSGEADFVVPDRGLQEGLKGYPQYQRDSEIKANKLMNNALVTSGLRGKSEPDIDFIGGTRVFDKKLSYLFDVKWVPREGKAHLFKQIFKSFDAEKYLRFYAPVVASLGMDKKVLSVPVDYKHPERQSEFERRKEKIKDYKKKRRDQLHDLVVGVTETARFVKEVTDLGVSLEELFRGKVSVENLELPDKVKLVPQM